MTTLFTAIYAILAWVAVTNFFLMRRPSRRTTDTTFSVLIPARNEAENIGALVKALLKPEMNSGSTVKVYVFDDESEDQTAVIAAEAGAIVIRATEPLPEGWKGKNRACHELAKVVTEDSDAEWMVFLDADVRPLPGFFDALRDLVSEVGVRVPLITGFPKVLPGRGIEPLFLGWVGWILLATNPYGLVSKTGKGHNRFTNGQFQCWKASVYTEIWPHEAVKDAILEDVKIGRLMARHGHQIETVNMSNFMQVKMYETWKETLDGMSKNSYEITGNAPGTIMLALLLLLFAWGWLLAGSMIWVCLTLLLLSGAFVSLIVRFPLRGFFLLPVTLSIGTYTMLRSLVWHKTKGVRWKGRVYTD